MKSTLRLGLAYGTLGLVGLGCSAAVGEHGGLDESSDSLSPLTTNADPVGTVGVVSTDATLNLNNPFFQNLGANGRACVSCHKIENALGISVAKINQIFTQTQGLDPIFRINDGSNAPTGFFANTSTVSARQTSFSMLLAHGTIRVGIGVPASRDFSLAAVNDPYGFAGPNELSLFRRPLPSVNMAFMVHVMWDGRESEGGRTAVRDGLINQANDATQGHAQRATPLDNATRAAIADFQIKLFAAQQTARVDPTHTTALNVPGSPSAEEAAAGNASNLLLALTQPSSAGGNGTFPAIGGGNPVVVNRNVNNPFNGNNLLARCPDDGVDHAGCFKNQAITAFEPWESADLGPSTDPVVIRRGQIGDGENTFYNRPFNVSGVAGLNDVTGKATVSVTCTTCHNTPQAGTNSSGRFFDTGVADASGANPLFTPDFPIYTFRRNSDQTMRSVTDPGLALRTGKFADIGRFKVPSLRALGARAPFFHNGSAKTLTDVVKFYNTRFGIGFTPTEITNLVLFLQQT
jgi:cytochrome c peroxidase